MLSFNPFGSIQNPTQLHLHDVTILLVQINIIKYHWHKDAIRSVHDEDQILSPVEHCWLFLKRQCLNHTNTYNVMVSILPNKDGNQTLPLMFGSFGQAQSSGSVRFGRVQSSGSVRPKVRVRFGQVSTSSGSVR
ncbi:hypothetical protein HELRODRAFT_165419 [Helobdella robusta]|uniref:Uncharacterized protein n=1 Tax=Helobdella robusta TaxID=6412 RepID=T1EWR5_HELRO|nr:hypothetical protein HELRODRAFT_165419 [Helobdella robusta]ESN91390.1 hypothetical protein HELRODRAFT_165419 [Helobdella robusta]